MYRIAWIFISLIVFLSCEEKKQALDLPFYNTPDFEPLFLTNKEDPSSRVTHQISDFNFTNQWGIGFGSKDIEDKITVTNFFFTGCGSICPSMMEKMKSIQKQFAKDSNIVFLSFSVTPWKDSVSVLKAYAQTNEIRSANWHLLTGPKSEIYNLARRSYFAEEQLGFSKDSTNFLHTEHVLLVDRSKRIRGIYNGTLSLDMEQLGKDIVLLLED
jgi:protein SCO1